MILPVHLLPSSLGLKWGMSKEHCLAVLEAMPLKESDTFVTVKIQIQGSLYDVHLLFDDSGGLERIRLYLYMSRSFWDEYSGEEIVRTEMEYRGHYDRLKEYYSVVLGPPNFSGAWGTAEYPEDEIAADITYWNHPEGRMQLEYDHPDKELPVFVSVSSFPVHQQENQ